MTEPAVKDAPRAAESASALERATAEALSAHGPLAEHDAAFIERDAQQAMAAAVARAIDRREPLVAEAGTGVGKTFAYLVPVLLSGRRALVSTATKALQDQLFLRDLPRLIQALKLPARLALLKGRSSYLCLHRLGQSRESATLPDRFAVRALARIEQWAAATRTGDLAEIEGLDDRSPVIPLVTSTRDNCLGTECPSYRDCHVMRARRDAMAADMVVVNHHLFFADMALARHRSGRVAADGRCGGVRRGAPIGRDRGAVPRRAARHQPVDRLRARPVGGGPDTGAWPASVARARRRVRTRGARPAPGLRGSLRDVRGVIKLAWDERAGAAAFQPALDKLHEALQQMVDALADLLAAAPDFVRLSARAAELSQRAAVFAAPCPDEHVRWIDVGPRDARLIESPLDIRELLVEQRACRHAGVDLHLGHAWGRCESELVQRSCSAGRRDQAARRQSVRLPWACARVGASAATQTERRAPSAGHW